MAKRLHAPYTKVKIFMCDNDITDSDIAKLLSKKIGTVKSKLNGKSDFTYDEAEMICNEYNMSPELFITGK